ncbi:MAG: type IV pilus modification protein PilV [Brachymonas sp.]
MNTVSNNHRSSCNLPTGFPRYIKQSGVSLIEVLVAVLILSFGLLGMGALQTRALQGNQSSTQKSQAIVLTNYMMDAMRIDRVNASAGAYNIDSVCSAAGVIGTTLASNNLRHWLNSANTSIGGQAGSPVCGTITCGTNFVCTIRLNWDDSRLGGLANPSIEVTSTI